MDKKLEMMLDYEVWEELFPNFVEKRIDRSVLTLLAQPKYRLGLIKMIEDGVYEFGEPREVAIPKDGGGQRLIYVLPDVDRCVMAVIAQVYTKLYSSWIHPACVSYQKGLSVPRTLHEVRRKLTSGGYKVDLSKYFDSVPIWKINEMLERMDTDSPVDQLLQQFYNTNLIERNGKVVEHFKSLGQGCAFSPLLANLCLASVDEELSDVCEVYLRYSDDILILGERADEALAILKERLSELSLELNPKKIQVLHKGEEFTFLGGKVSKERVGLSEKSWNKQKAAVRKRTKGKKGSRAEQKKCVKRLQKWLFHPMEGHCNMEYLSFLCTDEKDIERLDRYCRDELKAVYTGKHNHATNEHKTSNEQLQEMGWVSLVHLYRLYKQSPDVFRAKVKAERETKLQPKKIEEVKQIGYTSDTQVNLISGLVKQDGQFYKVERKDRPDVLQQIEDLWEMARLWEGWTPLNTNPKKDKVYSVIELEEIEMALKIVELLIATSIAPFEQYYWQSSKFPELVIFRDWM